VGEPPPDGVVGELPPLDGVVAPLDGEVDPLLGVVPVELLEEVVEDEVAFVALLATADGGVVGTVNCGAPAVSAVPVPPPPQAASPNPATIDTATAAIDLKLRAPGRLMHGPLRSRAAPCACRTRDSR
jgi:hypothetical protein